MRTHFIVLQHAIKLWIWESVVCVCVCFWVCTSPVCAAAPLVSETRRLDLPASRNVNYFSNLQAHFPQSLPSLGREWARPFRKPRSRPSLSIQICCEGEGNQIRGTIQMESRACSLHGKVPLRAPKSEFFPFHVPKQVGQWRIMNALM